MLTLKNNVSFEPYKLESLYEVISFPVIGIDDQSRPQFTSFIAVIMKKGLLSSPLLFLFPVNFLPGILTEKK